MKELKAGDSVNFVCYGTDCIGVLRSIFSDSFDDIYGAVEYFADEDESMLLVLPISRFAKVSHGLNFDMMGG